MVRNPRETTDPYLAMRDTLSSWNLVWALFSLWDNGFYEYSQERDRFRAGEAASELGLDPELLAVTLDYLTGHQFLRRAGDEYTITDKLRAWTVPFSRGYVTLYAGGYGRIFAQLNRMMRGEVSRAEVARERSLHHAAAGTAAMSAAHLRPKVVANLSRRGVILDLGCGTGSLLIELASADPGFSGVGVDLSGEAIAAARQAAEAAGVADRVRFFEGEIGAGPLPIPADVIASVETLSSLFMLHEFGRDESIIAVIEQLRQQFPGRTLAFLEVVVPDIDAIGDSPPRHLGMVDYLFMHPVSNQGPPLSPEQWEALTSKAGCNDFRSEPLAMSTEDTASGMIRMYSCRL